VASFCENGNEPSGFVKKAGYLLFDKLSDSASERIFCTIEKVSK
jgi:hypothetical protein